MCRRELKDLIVFIHTYIIIHSEEHHSHYSQVIVQLREDRHPLFFFQVTCSIPPFGPFIRHNVQRKKKIQKKKKNGASALVAGVRTDHAHLCHVVVLVRPLQERVGESQSRDALKKKNKTDGRKTSV